MIKTKIGVTPSLQSPKKDNRTNNTLDQIHLKIKEYEIKIPKLRDEIFKLEVELLQISNNNQKTAANSILENMEKKDEEYDILQKKFELSENLIQSFEKIINLYPSKFQKQNLVKSEADKNPHSPNNLITKPNLSKQINDFYKLTPLERMQKTQRVGNSRVQLKKKLELYQKKHFIKTILPLEEKERNEKNEYINLIEKDLSELEKINKRLLVRFGTNSDIRIASQLSYGRKINKDLKERYNRVKDQYRELTEGIRQYENNINMMSNPLHYSRLIAEGEQYKITANQKINELLEEASKRVTFGQKIFSSIQKIALLIDPNHTSSGISITELQWIQQKLAKKLHKNISVSSLKSISSIWTLTKSSLFPTIDENQDQSSSGIFSLNEDNAFSVPEIPLATIIPESPSFGKTRKTRRLLSALNSLRANQEDKQSYNYSLETLGTLLGNIFVDRFSPIFHQNDHFVNIKKPEILRIPKPISKIADLSSLLQLYIKYQSDLYMTQINNEEILILDPDFLYFSSEKEFFKENLKFSNEEFLEIVGNSINNNLIPCLWMMHDFAPKETVVELLEIITPIYNSNRYQFVISKPFEIISWAALFAFFFKSHVESVKYALFILYDPIFVRVLEKAVPSYSESSLSKCSVLALLRYGKHFPREFLSFIDLKNNSLTSFLHKFIIFNSAMPTFIQAAIEFANATFFLLEEEPLIWHTSLFFHYLINELMSEPIRPQFVQSYLSIICSIIEHRNSFTTSLFHRLYIIVFLKKNFELEELCSEKQNVVLANVDQDNEKELSDKDDNSNHSKEYDYEYEEEEEAFDLTPNQSQDEIKTDIPFIPPISFGSKNSLQPPQIDLSGIQKPPPINFNQSTHLTSTENNEIEQPPKIDLNSIQQPTKIDLNSIQQPPKIDLNSIQQPPKIDLNSIQQPPKIDLNSIQQPPKIDLNSIQQPPKIDLNSIQQPPKIDLNSMLNKPTTDVTEIKIPSVPLSNLSVKPSTQTNNISYNDLTNSIPDLLNLDNPKLQLHFQKSNSNSVPTRASVSFTNMDYMKQREMYPIYLTQDIHYLFVRMMFATLIDHSIHRFDVGFVDPFPFVNRKPNILFTLMQHMESSANEELKDLIFEHIKNIETNQLNDSIPKINLFSNPPLNQKFDDEEDLYEPPQIRRDMTKKDNNENKLSLKSMPPLLGLSVPKFIDKSLLNPKNNSEAVELDTLVQVKRKHKIDINDSKRLTKLTMPCLFNARNYLHGKHIASGAFGSVMVVTHGETKELLAVKVLKKSKNEYDNPHLFEVFTEVSILELLQNDRRVSQLKDYGCKSNSYYIIMEYYPTTMKSWRKKNTHVNIRTLLRLYREFLTACTVLVDKKINHYDIKCDNVMIDKNGHPCLADFGEAMSYTNETNCFTMLNKGTEWIKSPEMLSIALNSTITNPNFDRRKKIGAGPESDIWSIGCLFYELITGEFLFIENNWSHFFRRITEKDQILILPDNKKKLPNDKRFCAFLEFVLQRNVRSRPNLHQVITKFDEMFPEALKSPLPYIEIPKFE